MRELISYMIGAVMAEAGDASRRRSRNRPMMSAPPAAPLVAFLASHGGGTKHAIKAFLKQRMYRHTRVMRVMGEAEGILLDLFDALLEIAGDLPAGMGRGDSSADETGGARRIGNFIAGMTDRFALIEHQRLFDSTPDLR